MTRFFLMTQLSLMTLSVALAAAPGSSFAQQGGPITLQLPTFSSFTVSTSVLVPDRGRTPLGGVGRGASGRASFHPPLLPGAVGLGLARQSSTVGVSATIHDMQALDRAALNNAPCPAATAPRSPIARKLSRATKAPTDFGRLSVAEIRQSLAASQGDDQAEARGYFARGQQAEEQGKMSVAKIYYRMAAGRAKGDLQAKILTQLRGLEPARVAERRR